MAQQMDMRGAQLFENDNKVVNFGMQTFWSEKDHLFAKGGY